MKCDSNKPWRLLILWIGLLHWNLVAAVDAEFALDQRHAGQDLVTLVGRSSPSWQPHAKAIVHWSAYYQLSPLALLAALEAMERHDGWAPTTAAKRIRPLAKSFAAAGRLPVATKAQLQLRERFRQLREQLPPTKSNKAVNQPRMVTPIDSGRPWHFYGAHTWTGDDNGQPMSSIDLLVERGQQWGDDTSGFWVASAHDGVVTRFSECFLRVTHESGWFTDYYHLENPQVDSGDRVRAGQSIANYADDLATALCQGGRSALPHVHFALGLDDERVSISLQTFNDYRVHPGRYSYDIDFNYMWINEGQRRLQAWVDPLSRLRQSTLIDYHVNGMWYSPALAGHGLSLAVQPAESGQLAVFVVVYTYDDDGQANFYSGNVVADQWAFGDALSLPMYQSANGGFSVPSSIDFDNPADFATAGTANLTLVDCGSGQLELQLSERVDGQLVVHDWPLTKLIGVPVEQCEAAGR